MKYYKDENNNVYAYEADGSQDAYIPENLIAITEEEADELRNPPPVPPTADENKAKASQLLSDSDWVELPSVSDISTSPHLTNTAELIAWRASIRAIAVNPTAGDITWPVQPESVWSE